MSGTILLGPLLSFRGIDESDPALKLWRVTALVVLRDGPPSGTSPAQARLEIEDAAGGGITPTSPERRSPRLLGMIDPADHASGQVWRFDLTVPMRADAPRRVGYLLPGLSTRHGGPAGGRFEVPAAGAMPRLACAACNGFSSPGDIKRHELDEEDVWRDLRDTHGRTPFHLLLMGGDQVYADSVLEQPEGSPLAPLADWATRSLADQVRLEPGQGIVDALPGWYRRLYVERWGPRTRMGAPAPGQRVCEAVMGSIPTVMMWDDHDIIDGWGSLPAPLLDSPVMKLLFRHAREAFWMLQMQNPLLPASGGPSPLPDAATARNDAAPAPDWQGLLQDDPLAVRPVVGQGGFSRVLSVGPLLLMALDTRSERTPEHVVRVRTWKAIEAALDAERAARAAAKAPAHLHLVAMVSVPVAFPDVNRLAGAAAALDRLGGLLGLHLKRRGGDDLLDQWSLPARSADRLRLVKLLLRQAEGGGAGGQARPLRATLLSGDVHAAARGVIERRDYAPDRKQLRIMQLTSSGIVHPPQGDLGAFVMDHVLPDTIALDADHVARVLPLQGDAPPVVAARNWLVIEPVMEGGDGAPPGAWTGALCATWRCERQVLAMSPTQPPGDLAFPLLAPVTVPPGEFRVIIDPA